MFEQMSELLGGLDHLQKNGEQRAAVLATITATLRNSHRFDTVEEFAELLAMKILLVMQECPVGDYIDGKVVITLTEMIPDAMERMNAETKASFQRLKDLIESKDDEMGMDQLMDDLDIPKE